MLWLLIVVLLVLALAGLPTWPYMAGSGAGYWPSGMLTVILIVLLIFMLTGRA